MVIGSVRVSVKLEDRAGRMGLAGWTSRPAIVGSLLWWVGLAVEYPNDLFPPGDGSLLYRFNQVTFLAALVAWTVAIALWRRRRVAGPGRAAAWGFGIWAVGLGLVVIATVLTAEPVGALFPIGGLAITLGGAVVAVAALRADDLPLSRRLALIQLGLAWLTIYFVLTVLILGREDPTWWIEALLGASWAVAGLLVPHRSSVRHTQRAN